MRLDFEVFGERAVSRELLTLERRGTDMRPAFDGPFHEYFLDIENQQFSTEGSYSSGWKPLAPSTVAYKAKHHLDPRILHATLRLRKSMTSKDSPDHVYRSTEDSVMIGTRVPYGVYHQKGNGNNPPRRRVTALIELHRRNMIKILQVYLTTGLLRKP